MTKNEPPQGEPNSQPTDQPKVDLQALQKNLLALQAQQQEMRANQQEIERALNELPDKIPGLAGGQVLQMVKPRVGRDALLSRYGQDTIRQQTLRRIGSQSILHIRVPVGPLDPLAEAALEATREQYNKGLDQDAFLQGIKDQGISAQIEAVARYLSQSKGLSDLQRHVLAVSFAKSVKDILDAGNLSPEDKKEFADEVRFQQEAEDGPVQFFVTHIVEQLVAENKITVTDHEKRRLVGLLQWKGFSLKPGKIESAVIEESKNIGKVGVMDAYVEEFAKAGEIDKVKFTPAVKQGMVDYLLRRGIKLTSSQKDVNAFNNREYDEYFALAYEHSVGAGGGRDGRGLLQTARSGEPSQPWGFTVDMFEDVEEQGIVRENILAAGAIDYIYELGERMGIFRLADTLILNWSSGSIDVAAGEAGDMLYAYWKNRDDRSTPEDRGMLYKRVLGKGDSNILSRMVANEYFGQLWHNLMSEVAEYIRRTEKIDEGRGELSPVSKSRIYQATRELQYNLTEYCTGMAHKQARELYEQLQDAIAVLSHEDVMTHFGGSHRKSLWTVIEKLSKGEFESSPNIGATRSLAVDGNKVFRWIADFDKATVTNEQFDEFLEAAEAYILNMATVDEMPEFGEEEEDFDDELEDDELENEDDDFDDF